MVTKCWLESHVSDFSCFHFRQSVFTLIYNNIISVIQHNSDSLSEQQIYEFRSLLSSEMQTLNDLLSLYADQESLYIHRRFLLVSSVSWFSDEANRIKDNEMVFIDKQLSNSYSNSKSNHWHLELIRKHINYLSRKLGWSFDAS